MKPHTTHPGLIVLLVACLLALTASSQSVQASSSDGAALDAVWQRVHQSGAYHFSADVMQIDTPQASVINAGRGSRQTSLHLEGTTELDADQLHLYIWSGGGSVQMPETGVEVKVQGGRAMARQGNRPWEEIDDFGALFAPGGDFLAYSQAADNVVRHEPEIRSTLLGNIEVTRYTFDINGRYFAQQMQKQMQKQAVKEGLPPHVQLALPSAFADMNGWGEVWVGTDGLPLRQQLSLQFPPDKDNYVSSSEVVMDFSDFGQPASNSIAGQWWGQLNALFAALGNAFTTIKLMVAALALFTVWLVITRRRSKLVYATVAMVVVFSMVATPLLTTQRVAAYSEQQLEQQAVHEAKQADIAASQAWEEKQAAAQNDPHVDPLDLAEARAIAEAQPALQAQSTSSSRYFDISCETDPTGDLDGDGLGNLSECLLGTLPTVSDTDSDGASDQLEVIGFSYGGKMWYSNPLASDSNNDGIADGKELHLDAGGDGVPDDTDGDGVPDLWDDDNDGDGVRDDQDLSPYMTTAAKSASAKTFTSDAPLQLTMDNLVESELTKVEFQVVPSDSTHLRYTQTVLDWPLNDKQGQIQDADGLTFYDVDADTAANPGANGDMRLIPALEIQMPADSANLPPSATCTRDDGSTYTCYPLLEDFHITVRTATTGTLVAYVPLQLVKDGTGNNAMAFYGRMYYQAAASWGDAHEVRFVWMVQVLNDICEAFKDNICSAYSEYNVPQVVQTYDEEWFLSGLHVTEEHSAEIALIYEDPAIAPGVDGAPADYDQPFYVDTLYGLLNGLNQSFLVGRCDTNDADGSCAVDGQRDMTVATIYSRFNHATNGSVSATERWNLPNVLRVEANSYEAYDLGVLDTTVTQTVTILDNVFTPVWTAGAPITPTIMMASEQSYRDLNLDTMRFDSSNMQWSGNGLTLDWNGMQPDTVAAIKWTPYVYDPVSGWEAAELDGYVDDLTEHLSTIFDPSDSNTAATLTLNKLLYTTIFSGVGEIVELDGVEVEAEGAEEDEDIAVELTLEFGEFAGEVLWWIIEFDEKIEELAETLNEIERESRSSLTTRDALQIAFQKSQGIGFTVYLFEAIFLLLAVAEILIEQLTHDSPDVQDAITGIQIAIVTYKAVKTGYHIANAVGTIQKYLAVSETASESAAAAETVSETASMISLSQVLTAFTFVLNVAVAVGTLIYLATSDSVQPGSPQYTVAVLTTLITLIIAVALTLLAMTNPIGLAIVSILSFVDALLQLLGEKWSVTGWVTENLVSIIYKYDLVMELNLTTGPIEIELGDPDLGVRAGNEITYTMPMTTTFSRKDNCFSFNLTREDLQGSRIWFVLSEEAESESAILKSNGWSGLGAPPFDGWDGNMAVRNPSYRDTLEAGVNRIIPLVLNTTYKIMGQNRWQFIIVNTCQLKWMYQTVSTEFGDALALDVLPATVDDFVDVGTWSEGNLSIRNIDADGDGLISTEFGGMDTDDDNWDRDGDNLADGYELTIRSLPADSGGLALNINSADTDGDGIPDDVELHAGSDPTLRDTDGDGLPDLIEQAPDGGWMLAYAYDVATDAISETRIWSNPVRADADGDGMSDLFEQTQDTIQTAPFADPTNPLVYNPGIWNESPVALYVTDSTNDGLIVPGETVFYTATTINNLSSSQQLVGNLSLDLPSGVNADNMSQLVELESGESTSLVSTLTFDTSTSAAYALSSGMSLVDFDETVWSWDEENGSSRSGIGGTPRAVAVASVEGWEAPYVVASVEKASSGEDTVNTYLVDSDGTVKQTAEQVLPTSTSVFVDPAVACNDDATCVVIWGTNASNENTGYVTGAQLANGLANQSTVSAFGAGEAIATVAIATDGADFMVAWSASSDSGATTTINVTSISATKGVGNTTTVATVGAATGSAAIAWTGSSYTLVWTGDGALYQARASTSGVVSDIATLGAGEGWPQDDGSVHAPAIAYDPISGQALVIYRSTSGEMVARRLLNGVGEEFTLTSSGVDGNNVTVALSADPKNSGWVVAWLPSDGSAVEYRAISPLGNIRGSIGLVDPGALTAVALACNQAGPILLLDFDEEIGANIFADSSGNDRNAICSDTCPTAGASGKSGNAVSYTTADQGLAVEGIDVADGSFTVAAWAAFTGFGAPGLILSQGEFGDPADHGRNGLRLGISEASMPFCLMNDSVLLSTPEPLADTRWHHWACTYEATTKLVTFYRDGQAVDSATAEGNYTGGGTFYIGNNPQATQFVLQADIDNVVVYNRALSAVEIDDVFDVTLAVFDLDEADGSSTFVNVVPTGINGICSGDSCPTMGVQGKSYTAALFDGVDDYIEVPAVSGSSKTYYYTFDDNNYTGWSPGSDGALTASVGGKSTKYLDSQHNSQFSGNINLRLSDLPEHDTITISYDLYILGSGWGGNLTGSTFAMNVDNIERLNTTFANTSGTLYYQAYPNIDGSYPFDGATLYHDGSVRYNDCSGISILVKGDIPDLSTTALGNRQLSCLTIPSNTVARLHANPGHHGTPWEIDPGRNQYPSYPNDIVSSVTTWPAGYLPMYGSVNKSLTVSGISDSSTSLYHIEMTYPHANDSLWLLFHSLERYGLDNVKIDVVKSDTSIPLKDSSFTLSAWAKRADTGRFEYLISQGESTKNIGLHFGFRENDKFTCAFYNNDLNTPATYTDLDWHHWVCTYDSLTKLRTLYRDGVEVAQDTAAENFSGDGPTQIGRRYDGEYNFKGEIDEIGVWPVALSESQVAELYRKVKVEDQSTLTCQLPLAQSDGQISFGVLTLRETATLLGDISQTIARTITVDGDKPSTTAIELEYFSQESPGGYTSSSGMLILSGSAADDSSYIASVELLDGDEWQTANGAETWSYGWNTSALSDGPQTLQVRATDAVGNQSDPVNWYTILDRTPPIATISEPLSIVRPNRNAEGRWQVAISGTAVDPDAGAQPGSGVSTVEVLLQGATILQGLGWQPATLNGDGTWSVDYVLPVLNSSGEVVTEPSGVYTASVRASDAVSNITPAANYALSAFTVDATAPMVVASTSLSDTKIISQSMVISMTVTDNQDVESVEVNFTTGAQMGALEGALLHLPMDERHATEYFDDQSGAKNNAVCSGSQCPTVGQAGQRDLAFSFDGIDDIVTLVQTDTLSLDAFTIALWVKPTEEKTTWQPLVTKESDTGGERNYGLYIAPDSMKVNHSVGQSDCSTLSSRTSTSELLIDQWNHVVMTFDGFENSLYINGALDGSVAYTGTLCLNDYAVRIGSEGSHNMHYAGDMDEVMVFDRALAAYEIANLLAYGQGSWEAATANGDSWQYTIPDGDNGIEGIYQLNVRGTDALGNVTTLGGQRYWRGEIDTKAPSVQFFVTSDGSGSTPSTTYECVATDFNLVQESDTDGYQQAGTSCVPGLTASPPAFRNSDITLTDYETVDEWYAATVTTTARLYTMEATRTYEGTADANQTMTACDLYSHCTEVPATTTLTQGGLLGAEVLSPGSNTVLTTTEAISVTGDAYAINGLQTLAVAINDATEHILQWETGDETNTIWSFPWMPPGEGLFEFTYLIDDWTSDELAEKATLTQAETAEQGEAIELALVELPDMPLRSFLPLVTNIAAPQANSVPTTLYLPYLESLVFTSPPQTDSMAIFYVDLTPPQINIGSTTFTAADQIMRNGLLLTGHASDSVQLHRVDVRIGNGIWRRARLDDDGNWQIPWRLEDTSAFISGQQVEVSARVMDIAGRTTTVTETVTIMAAE